MNPKLGGGVCFAVFRQGSPQLECLGGVAEPAAAPWCAFTLSCHGFVSSSSVQAGGQLVPMPACIQDVSCFFSGTLLTRASGTSRCCSSFAACAISSMYLFVAMCARVWHSVFQVSACSGAHLLSGSDHRWNNPSR